MISKKVRKKDIYKFIKSRYFNNTLSLYKGYRSIMDAMKSFAIDTKVKNKSTVADIEVLVL